MIATEWKEFMEIDWQTVYDNMTKPAFVFDGRLILDAEKLRKIGFRVSTLRLRLYLFSAIYVALFTGQGYRPG